MKDPINPNSTPIVKNTSSKKTRFFLTFIGSVIYSIGIAGCMCIGQFNVYITSYVHKYDNTVDLQYGNLMSPIVTCSLALSAPLGGILEKKIGMHFSLILSLLLVETMVALLIYQTSMGIIFLLLIFLGLSIGLGMPILVKNLMCFYPKKRGLVCALLPSCLIIVAASFSIIGEKIINPNQETLEGNEKFYKYDIAKNFINYYKMILIVNPISLLIGLLLQRKFNPLLDIENSENSQISENISTNIENNNEPKKNAINSQNLKAAICNKRTWIICGMNILFVIIIEYLMNTFRVYGSLTHVNGAVMQYAGAFIGLSSLIFAPSWGFINDKISFTKTSKIIGILCLIHGLILTIFINNNVIYVICVFIATLPAAGFRTILQPHIMKVYGIKYSIEIGGVIGFFGGIKTLLLGFLSFAVAKFDPNGDNIQSIYRYIFIVGIVCCTFGLFLSTLEDESKFKYPFLEEDESGNLLNDSNLMGLATESTSENSIINV